MMTIKTRDRIILYLQKHPRAGTAALSRALGVTLQDARYHLASLEAAGQVVRDEQSSPAQRGRPRHYYQLNPGSLAGRTAPLLDALLDLYLKGQDSDGSPGRTRTLAEKICGEDFRSVRSPAMRVNRAIHKMAGLGYLIRWEARPHGPRVFIDHSPFAAACRGHPAADQLDQDILEALTGYTLLRTNKPLPGKELEGPQVFDVLTEPVLTALKLAGGRKAGE